MMFRSLVVCCVLAACGDQAATSPQLVKTTPEPAGTNCPNGGTAIQVGTDADNDGILDDSEVSSTSYVCSGASQPRELVVVVTEPAGANCADGGQAVEIGADTNGNGTLDSGEVTSTSYVCASPPGTATLVAVVVEPAGVNCANGGQVIETGPDSNGNGTLDGSEIASASYVCAGTDGQQPLIRIDAEPAGANCSAGGNAINVGLDANSDNILENSEIQSTTYLCSPPRPTTIEGNFVVNNSVDAAALVGVTTITGSLTIDANGLTAIDVSSLQTVAGAVMMQNNSTLPVLDFASLTSVGSVRLKDNLGLTELDFPVLAQVTSGNFNIDGNAFLAALSLPALASISGAINVANDNNMTSFTAPVLTQVGGSVTLNNVSATTVDLSALQSVGAGVGILAAGMATLDLSSLTSTPQVELDLNGALTSVDLSGVTTTDYFVFQQNAALTAVSAPNLTTVNTLLMLFSNPQLASISFPSFTSDGGDFDVESNPVLPTCQVTALATQCAPAGTVTITGNDDTATCP